MEINVTVQLLAPELTAALLALASAKLPAPIAPAAGTPPPAPIAAAVPVAAPVASSAAPPIAVPVTPPTMAYAPGVSPQAPPTAPVAQAPVYHIDALANAAAGLMQAGRQQELVSLLAQFGVQALTHLKPDQYGAFATALRQIGGRI